MSIKRKDCQICGQFFSSDQVRRKHQRENHPPVKKGRPCIGLAPKTKEERNAFGAAQKKKKEKTKRCPCWRSGSTKTYFRPSARPANKNKNFMKPKVLRQLILQLPHLGAGWILLHCRNFYRRVTKFGGKKAY